MSNNPNSVYEVECYMSAYSGTAANTYSNINSLEWCMDLCTQAGSNNCLVASWTPGTPGSCSLFTLAASGGGSPVGGLAPNNLVFNTRTARLLTPAAPYIVDATYLLAPNPQYNLGLCTGTTFNYYDRTFIGVYHQDNTIRGPGSRPDLWLITCLSYTYYSGQATTVSSTSTLATGFGLGYPQTADDCARLCAFTNVANGDTGTNNCRLWHWTNANICTLYASRNAPATPVTVTGVVAAGLYRGGTSSEYAALSYKRSLPPGVGPGRNHARDSMADTGHTQAEVIIPWTRRT